MSVPGWVWLDGVFVRGAEARVSVFDRGLHFGDGLYETLLAVDGAPRHLDQHWARLMASAEFIEVPPPAISIGSAEHAESLVAELLDRCALTAGRARVKITLTRGVNHGFPWHLETPRATLLITAIPAPLPSGQPLRLATLPVRRDAAETLWQHKTTNMLGRGLARAGLARRGLDDGLILNTAGRVCEATTSNLFAVVEGCVVTPPVTEGCLRGTVRARLLALMENESWPLAERPLTPVELHRAECVWLSNAIVGALPVASLDGQPFVMSDTGRRLLSEVQAMAGA